MEDIEERKRAKELQDLAIAMIDARERARVQALEERSRIIHQKVANMNTFMAKVRDREAEDLAKAERERVEHEKEQDRKDAARKAAAKKRMMEQQLALRQQVAHKKQKKQKQVEYVLDIPCFVCGVHSANAIESTNCIVLFNSYLAFLFH